MCWARLSWSESKTFRISYSIKNSFQTRIDLRPPELLKLYTAFRIDFGRPELYKLNGTFLLRSPLRKASISNLQRSGGPHSSFPLRILLRKALISDVQSSRGSTARFRTSRALEAPELISIKSSIKKRIDFGPPELWRLQSSFLLRVLLRKASI